MTHDSTSPTIPLKRCTKCGQEKPATADFFTRTKRSRDGLYCHCKECRAAYAAANREHIAEYMRVYTAANRERILERKREWHAANRERHSETNRAWHVANRERILERKREWRKANRPIVAASRRRRRARKRSAEGFHTAEDIRAQYERQHGRCYYCHKKVGNTYHVDHVIPLSRGGSNGLDNLVITCPPCNLSKNNKLPVEWPEGGRLL